jgi:hypothetical protein
VKVVDKTPARHTKRNATGEAPTAYNPTADGRGARRGGYGGNDAGEDTFDLSHETSFLLSQSTFWAYNLNSS